MTTNEEIHDALCPALTGGKCGCTESPVTVDKSWAQFCGGIGRGPDAPYPGMIEAFETHYGQSFTDRDWRNETAVWAAAWSAATVKSAAQRKVLEMALEALNDITKEISMKRFWREKDEKRFDEIADEAIIAIQGVFK